MATKIVDRSAAEAVIREQIVSEIFQDAPKQSTFMSMARKLPNMTSNQTRIRVLDFLPTAYWVDGDTGMKQTSQQAWDNVYLTAAELAVIALSFANATPFYCANISYARLKIRFISSRFSTKKIPSCRSLEDNPFSII